MNTFHQDRDRIFADLNVLNQGVLEAIADCADAMPPWGFLGLSRDTLVEIAKLSSASTIGLSKARIPFLTASIRPIEGNKHLRDLPPQVQQKWHSLAAAYSIWLRANWDRYNRSMTVVCGSRCKCEQDLPKLDLASMLGGGERVLMYVSSRLTDAEWSELVRYEPGQPQWQAQVQYIHQKMSAASGCNGCPRPTQP